MKNLVKYWVVILLGVLFADELNAAKLVKIRLTGTCRERIEVTFGDTGRKEVICNLPVVYEVPKEQLPMTLNFESENYVYYSIQVPRKPFDSTGHVYLVKIDEEATDRKIQMMASRNGMSQRNELPEQDNLLKDMRNSDVDIDIPISSKSQENTFAVIIANENYQEEVAVEYARNDGEAFREYCLKTLGIPEKNIHLKMDATLNNMNSELEWMKNVAGAYGMDAKMIFFYAGHGIPNESNGDSYLLPVDGKGTMLSSGYSVNELYDLFGSFQVESVTVFMDACFSGSKRGDGMLVEARGIAIKAKPSEPVGNVVVLSAAQGDETAYPYKEKGHGLFTYFLLKKLQETKGKVNMEDLSEYVRKQVSRISIVENGKNQTPNISVSAGLQNGWKKMMLKD